MFLHLLILDSSIKVDTDGQDEQRSAVPRLLGTIY